MGGGDLGVFSRFISVTVLPLWRRNLDGKYTRGSIHHLAAAATFRRFMLNKRCGASSFTSHFLRHGSESVAHHSVATRGTKCA